MLDLSWNGKKEMRITGGKHQHPKNNMTMNLKRNFSVPVRNHSVLEAAHGSNGVETARRKTKSILLGTNLLALLVHLGALTSHSFAQEGSAVQLIDFEQFPTATYSQTEVIDGITFQAIKNPPVSGNPGVRTFKASDSRTTYVLSCGALPGECGHYLQLTFPSPVWNLSFNIVADGDAGENGFVGVIKEDGSTINVPMITDGDPRSKDHVDLTRFDGIVSLALMHGDQESFGLGYDDFRFSYQPFEVAIGPTIGTSALAAQTEILTQYDESTKIVGHITALAGDVYLVRGAARTKPQVGQAVMLGDIFDGVRPLQSNLEIEFINGSRYDSPDTFFGSFVGGSDAIRIQEAKTFRQTIKEGNFPLLIEMLDGVRNEIDGYIELINQCDVPGNCVGSIGIRGDASDYINQGIVDFAAVLETGSPAAICQRVLRHNQEVELSFDLTFLSPSGEISIYLGNDLLASFDSTNQVMGVPSRNQVTIPAATSNDIQVLKFVLEGDAGQRAVLDNVEYPSLRNGDFNSLDDDWSRAEVGGVYLAGIGSSNAWSIIQQGASRRGLAINLLTDEEMIITLSGEPDSSYCVLSGPTPESVTNDEPTIPESIVTDRLTGTATFSVERQGRTRLFVRAVKE